MQTQHGVAVVGILRTHPAYRLYGLSVYARHKEFGGTSILTTLDNKVEVFKEFLAVKVSMSVDVVDSYFSLFIILAA